MSTDKIVIKGAREHNLKNVDVTIPRDKLIVMTGLSGSGKSSLAFDTILSLIHIFTLPSSSDMAVTREIYRALRLVNIQLLEHLIFADNEFLSFVQSNYMDSIRQSVQD